TDGPASWRNQRDNDRHLQARTRLRALDTTVVVVEKDEDTISAADHVVDMGPKAGVHGGRIVAAGTPEEIEGNSHSITGAYLSGRKRIEVPRQRRQSGNRSLSIRHAKGHNLRDLTVSFPIRVFTSVTGVSPSPQ